MSLSPVLFVSGPTAEVERSFSLAALRAMKQHLLGPLDVACLSGRAVARVESYAGVRLIDVLDAAGLSQLHRAELKRCVVAATGLDGYQALFSWCELYNSPLGIQVLVLLEREGQPMAKPLDGYLGELALISAGDSQLGPRHLRQLRSVAVRTI